MRIAFDTQVFSFQELGGISRYICALAAELYTFPGIEARIVAPLHFNTFLKSSPKALVRGHYVRYFPKTGQLIRAASVLLSAPYLRAFKPDVLHETYYWVWPTAAFGTPRVLTVHDMIHEKFPSLFPPGDPNREWKARSIARADHVICISAQTRQDLLEFYDVPHERVSVIHNGYDRLSLSAEAVSCIRVTQSKVWGGRPFLLFVGMRGGHKNFSGFLKAYAASTWLKNNFAVVCFGGGEFRQPELQEIRDLGVHGQVFQLGGDDGLLAACYSLASAFVYPSLYEGFGIPPLEAMSLGCPVFCGKVSAIPEVVGGAGEYFDPCNVDSIRSSLESTLRSSTRINELIRLGASQCGQFSWNRCASETLGVYQKLAG